VLVDRKNVNVNFVAIIEEINNINNKAFKEKNDVNNRVINLDKNTF